MNWISGAAVLFGALVAAYATWPFGIVILLALAWLWSKG